MDDGCRTDGFLDVLKQEMRNSLSALRHSLDVWSMSNPGLMDDLRHIMERQVRQLTRLSDDLLDTGRITRGELEMVCECVSLQDVIEEAGRECRPAMDDIGQTLSLSLPDAPIIIFGDSVRLVQVFANLLQNSVKCGGRNGSLCISVEVQPKGVRVRVSGNGRRIDEPALATDFDAAPVSDVSGVPVNDGLDLGLKLANAIVQSHGGSVAGQSSGRGQGCEFTVLLPTWNEADYASRSKSLPLTVPANLLGSSPPAYRIVIVDDDPELGELLAKLLRTIGQSVTVTKNGMTALELILQNRPQVVFLDLLMGEHGGYEVACQLRNHTEMDEVVLIAMSCLGDEQHKRRAQDAGCDLLLVKPISLLDFASILEQVSSIGRARN